MENAVSLPKYNIQVKYLLNAGPIEDNLALIYKAVWKMIM